MRRVKQIRGENLTVMLARPAYMPGLAFFYAMSKADLLIYDDLAEVRLNDPAKTARFGIGDRAFDLSVPTGWDSPARGALNNVVVLQQHIAGFDWRGRHVGALVANYPHAPAAPELLQDLADILSQPWRRLVDLDINLIWYMGKWFGLNVPTIYTSDLAAIAAWTSDLDTTARPLAIAVAAGAKNYILRPGEKVNPGAFEDAGMRLVDLLPIEAQWAADVSAIHWIMQYGSLVRGLCFPHEGQNRLPGTP